MLKVEGRWAERIEELLTASDNRLGIKPKDALMRTCKICGGEFVAVSNRRYCGDACRAVTIKAYNDARRLEKRLAQSPSRHPTS